MENIIILLETNYNCDFKPNIRYKIHKISISLFKGEKQ